MWMIFAQLGCAWFLSQQLGRAWFLPKGQHLGHAWFLHNNLAIHDFYTRVKMDWTLGQRTHVWFLHNLDVHDFCITTWTCMIFAQRSTRTCKIFAQQFGHAWFLHKGQIRLNSRSKDMCMIFAQPGRAWFLHNLAVHDFCTTWPCMIFAQRSNWT